jgi:O-antigen ligase
LRKITAKDAPVLLAGAAAVATVVSIAAFEVLLGLAIVALLIERQHLRLPPNTIPFGLWVSLTLASAAASSQASAALPQLKKFYVYTMLFVVYAAFRRVEQAKWLAIFWGAGGALSALWSLVQFSRKYAGAQAAHENFYLSYVGARITGFMGHWMTFSGQMMMVLLILGAFLFFAAPPRRTLLLAAIALVGVGLMAAFTRSMWLGALIGAVYLIWIWNKKLLLALPILAGVMLAANPFSVRDRAVSAFEPHGDVDSNEHRVVTRRVGYQMIKAHPWFGVGPEEVGPNFKKYLPSDIHEPLPTGYYGHLHNIYIHYAAERGVPAMLALMWFLLQPLYDFARGVRAVPVNSRKRWVLHGAIAVFIAVMVSGFYELNLGDSEVLGLFLAVMGVGYAALKSRETEPISTMWHPPANT